MGKDKLRRFAAIKTFDNVVEPTVNEPFDLKGQWKNKFFNNSNTLVLELGCGKGEYSVGMGQLFPETNFLGLDLKGNRIFIGARDALEQNLKNVGFLRIRIDFIEQFFAKDEVDEIWLTFSDPQPGKTRKRLTSPLFINRYRQFLKPGGLVHLKTDSDVLFDYTLEQIEAEKYEIVDLRADLYNSLIGQEDNPMNAIFRIQTHYEKLFTGRGHRIKYVCFKIN